MMEHLDAALERQRAEKAAEASMVVTDPDVLQALEQIGLHEPDYNDPLHRRLVNALVRTRRALWGDRLVAMKFEINWAQFQAGKDYAELSTAYAHQVDVRTVPLVNPADGSKGLTRAFAEQTVRAQDDMYDMQLRAAVAEKREQSLRHMLDTLRSAIQNEQTNRSDARAGDQFHARSAT